MDNRQVPPGDSARRKALSHFETADARTSLVKKMMEDERKAVDAKTAKLRAQRLAKEEAERLDVASRPAATSSESGKTKSAGSGAAGKRKTAKKA